MYLLPPNFNTNISSIEHDHRNIDHHISSMEIQQSMSPFKTNRDMNHKSVALAYSLQPNLSQDYYNGNMHQNNLSVSPMNSSVCTRICDPILITKKSGKIQLPEFNTSLNHNTCERRGCPCLSQGMKYENLPQPYSVTNQQNMWTQSNSLCPLSSSSSSSIIASTVPSTKTERKYKRRINQSPVVEQQRSSRYLNTTTQPIFLNNCSSLLLPYKTNALHRLDKYRSPVNFIRTTHLTPLSLPNLMMSSNIPSTMIYNKSRPISTSPSLSLYSTIDTFEQCPRISEQLLPVQKSNLGENNNHKCSTNNLMYNLPYCMVNCNRIPITTPPVTYSSVLSSVNTTGQSLSISTSKRKNRRRAHLRESKIIQNFASNMLINGNSMVPTHLVAEESVLRENIRKTSKINSSQAKALIRRIKQRNKLAILKFMIQKQQRSKKKITEGKTVTEKLDVNITKASQEIKLPDNIALNLKINFNVAQEIDTISLHYYQRHRPEITKETTFITSNSTVNKLGLLIEAVNFIEKYNETPQLTLESNK
ncbi:unnamed protein product [Rotaria socialis]|nr:unnamed protein product [Rotaria socialis]